MRSRARPEVRLRVEVDVAEDAFELGAVLVLDFLERDVDQLADVRLVALRVKIVEARAFGQDEALALQPAADSGLIAAVLFPVGLDVVVPEVRDVLQE